MRCPLVMLLASRAAVSAAPQANCSAAHFAQPGDHIIDGHESQESTFFTHELFPTKIATTRCEDAKLQKDLTEWVLAQLDNMRSQKEYAGRRVTNDEFHRWQTQTQAPLGEEHLLPPSSTMSDPFHQLRRLARQQCTRFLISSSGGGDETEVDAFRHHLGTRELIAWAATYDGKMDDGHDSHDHGDALCSGVLYLRMPTGAPPLMFSDPRLVGERLKYAAAGGYDNTGGGGYDNSDPGSGTNLDRSRRLKRKRMSQWMQGNAERLAAVADDVDMVFASSTQQRGPFRSHALLQPRDGDMVLFPPWLFHSVPKEWAPTASLSEAEEVAGGAAAERGERLVFAFNLLQAATR